MALLTEVKHESTADLARCAADRGGRMVPQSGVDEAHGRVCLGCRALSRCVVALPRIPAEARGGICQWQPGCLVQAVPARHGIAARASLREPPGVRRGCRRDSAAPGLGYRTDGPG